MPQYCSTSITTTVTHLCYLPQLKDHTFIIFIYSLSELIRASQEANTQEPFVSTNGLEPHIGVAASATGDTQSQLISPECEEKIDDIISRLKLSVEKMEVS